MSNIDKRALREIAEAAVGAHERLSVMPPDDIFDISLAEGTRLDADITALNALNSAANPPTVLAMLDELEAKDSTISTQQQEIRTLLNALEQATEKRMAELESDKSRMMDALHAAVALNSAGISLNDFDECVLRLHEWGALPDYCIALYVDFIHGLVSENKLLDFGYVNDNGAFSLRQAEKRIAEQPSQKRLIGWRASDYTDETSDPELAKNWAAAIGVLPIFEGDVNTKLSAAGIGKGE